VLWDAATGGGLRILQDDSASRRVFFSPDGRTLVAELRDAIQLWDVESGKKRHKVEAGVYSSVALSLDGRTLAVGDQETVKLWDVATGNRLRVLRGSAFTSTNSEPRRPR
jgi:WD40 repeat protein